MSSTKAVDESEIVSEFGWSILGQHNQNHIVWPKPQWFGTYNMAFLNPKFSDYGNVVAMLTTKISFVAILSTFHHFTSKN